MTISTPSRTCHRKRADLKHPSSTISWATARWAMSHGSATERPISNREDHSSAVAACQVASQKCNPVAAMPCNNTTDSAITWSFLPTRAMLRKGQRWSTEERTFMGQTESPMAVRSIVPRKRGSQMGTRHEDTALCALRTEWPIRREGRKHRDGVLCTPFASATSNCGRSRSIPKC